MKLVPPICSVLLLVLLGCRQQVHHRTTREDLPGVYLFNCDASLHTPVHQMGETLTLRRDGNYEIGRTGGKGAGSILRGHWIFENGNPPTVYLDHSGYPLKWDGDQMELVVNEDVNAHYVKVH